jgi:diguanylate cyclase
LEFNVRNSTIYLQNLRLDAALKLLGRTTADLYLESADGAQLLQTVIDGLCDLSQRDPLTGLANRRHFISIIERELDRVARSGDTALLLMVDIDFFKYVNDTHGHPAGDEVIQAVGRRLAQCVRPMDTVARYGGEEFAVVLPTCPDSFAHAVTKRIHLSIEREPVVIASGEEISVTISVGGVFAPSGVRVAVASWVERADQQLYRAKASGRNRTCLEDKEMTSAAGPG